MKQSVTASEGAPARGTFETTLHAPSAGDATVTAFAPSAEDGSPQHQVDVPVTVMPELRRYNARRRTTGPR